MSNNREWLKNFTFRDGFYMLAYKDIIVISAPSGTGKTTINRRLVKELSDIEMSVSYTTRDRRLGEKNGSDYWFKTKKEFESLIDSGRMLEWAMVFNNHYGTSFDELDRITSRGKKILLEIILKDVAKKNYGANII